MNEEEITRIADFINFLNDRRKHLENDLTKIPKLSTRRYLREAELIELELVHNVFDLIVLGKKKEQLI